MKILALSFAFALVPFAVGKENGSSFHGEQRKLQTTCLIVGVQIVKSNTGENVCAVDFNGKGCSASDLNVGEELNAYPIFSGNCDDIDSCRLVLTGSNNENNCDNYKPYSFGDACQSGPCSQDLDPDEADFSRGSVSLGNGATITTTCYDNSGCGGDEVVASEITLSTQAPSILWISPLGATTSSRQRQLNLDREATLLVTSSEVGDSQWVDFPLFLQDHFVIKAVTLCYGLSSTSSYISQIRLIQANEPPGAFVMHDDGTDHKSTTPECVTSIVDDLQPNGAITLSLRLNFADTAHEIDIGAIGILLGEAP